MMKPLPKNEPKVEIQRTLEMNIMDMILQRRSKISKKSLFYCRMYEHFRIFFSGTWSQ